MVYQAAFKKNPYLSCAGIGWRHIRIYYQYVIFRILRSCVQIDMTNVALP